MNINKYLATKFPLIFLLIFFVIFLLINKNYQIFDNFTSEATDPEYPCRVFLSDDNFLKHMITHHEMAIDISIRHIKNTKSDILIKILRELIWTQKNEIVMMKQELNHKTENISEIISNKSFIPTVFSSIYPNVIGLSDTYCDPNFFNSTTHNLHNMVLTDNEYINHMIPHHKVAVDMCKILLKNTKSDFLIYFSYRIIRAQEAEIILLNNLYI
jgi:hypothetical protein